MATWHVICGVSGVVLVWIVRYAHWSACYRQASAVGAQGQRTLVEAVRGKCMHVVAVMCVHDTRLANTT